MFEENCGHSTENTFSCAEIGSQVLGSVITETTGLLAKITKFCFIRRLPVQ